MTTTPASGDRETEAAIRKRIAEEIREFANLHPISENDDDYDYLTGWRVGLTFALAIIERGTGVAGEEESNGTQ